MLVILKPNPDPARLEELLALLQASGITVRAEAGAEPAVLMLSGDLSRLNTDRLAAMEIVAGIHRLQEPWQRAGRSHHPEDTVVEVRGVRIGGGSLALMAGPCTVESEEQTVAVARAVKAAGAAVLRGGAFKPRTSPYSFQGLGEQGIAFLKTAREETGLPIVTELMDASQLPLFRDVDLIQIGARNMQNYALLKAVSRQEKPVLLKRGLSATYEEWLMAAEYILDGGNPNVILCERGIRTFEPYTRSTLDISSIPAIRSLTHLPVIADPSHAAGRRELVVPLSRAAIAAGADGLLLEVHTDPAASLCDGKQALSPEEFAALSAKLRALSALLRAE